MNNEYRLQLLNHGEIFPTREEAVEYIEDNFKGVALWAEPGLAFYGTEREPKMILAFGASKTATRPRVCYIDDAELREMIAAIQEQVDIHTGQIEEAAERILNIVSAVGLTLDENRIKDQIHYEPDPSDELIGRATSVAEAIAIISTFVQEKIKDLEFDVVDSRSIDLNINKTEDKTLLTGEVRISTEGQDDELDFNNNIVGIKPDGIFAACNMEYDPLGNRLIFTTSGVKNGRFVTDANVKIIELGEHTKYHADNEGHTVEMIVDNERGTLSADVKIASDETNILQNHDGRLLVDGKAKNIKYKGTTVAAALNTINEEIDRIKDEIRILMVEDFIQGDESDTILTKAIKNPNGGYTVTADVRLSSDESIQVANGGIKANVDINVDSTNNKLILSVGNNTKEVQLPGISIVDNIYYDAVNKCIVITWKDGTQKTVIPVGDMLNTWIVDNNPQSPVVLTKTEPEVAGDPEKLSADIKLASTDNLIAKDAYGQLFVSRSAIDNKIAEEATAREAADAQIRSAVEAEENARREADEVLDNKIDTTKDAIYARIDADEERINEAYANAEEAKAQVELTNANLNAEISRATTAEGVNADAIAAETSRATAAENAIDSRLSVTESGLAAEKTTRSTADAVHDEQISNLQNALAAAEASHREDVERLSAGIRTNTESIAVINGSETVSGSMRELVKGAKDELNQTISNEVTRATAAEQRVELLLQNEELRATQAEAAAVTTANAYTDHAVADSKHMSDDYTDAAKAEAIATSKAYTDSKVAEAGEASTSYTDTKVNEEKNRAVAAETANANAIVALQEKDIQIEGELADKVSEVKIVKNSQSDLQYILKVDGQDAGEINIPKDQFLVEVLYNSVSKELTFVFETQTGRETTTISIADLIDTYLAGNGIVLNGNVFSVKVNPASEFLSVDADGIKVTGINAALATKADASNVYTKAEADGKFLTEHQDISHLATKVELEAETTRATAAEQFNTSRIVSLEGEIVHKVEHVEIVKNSQSDLQYILKVDGQDAGEINIPKDQFLESVTYNEQTKTLEFIFITTDGRPSIVRINISDLVDVYTAGNGLNLNGNVFSVAIDPSSDEYITLTPYGIKISGIKAAIDNKANAADVYTKTEADNKFLTEHQDISYLATKEQVNTEVARLDAKDAELTAEVNRKVETVEVEKNPGNELQYFIIVDGTRVGTIDIPKDQFLKEVRYDSASKTLIFTFETTEGTKIVNVPIGDLVNTYTAGNGLKLVDNQFSVKINPASEFITADEDGIKVTGISAALANKANVGDSYTKAESDAKYITEHQDLTPLTDRITANENAITVINGNEAQEGSIKKSLADAKAYADALVTAEKAERQSVDATKANVGDSYTKAESDSKYLTSASIENLATKAELAAETTRATAAEEANAAEIVNLKNKDIQIENELAEKVEDVKIVKGDTDFVYRLFVDNVEKGVINIPEDQFLKNVSYNPVTRILTFVFETSAGERVVDIDMSTLVDTYTAGNGLQLDANNQFSVKINEDSESYITVTAEGIKISGIDAALASKANVGVSYTKAESDAKYLTGTDIEGLATKAEVTALDNKVEGYNTELNTKVNANTDAITTLNGNALVEGSVDYKVKAAKDALEAEIAVKANAADVYTKTEIDNKGFLTDADIEGLATKAEVTTEVARLDAKDVELTTEVNKKVETVQVVKSTGSDLSYDIRVDGQSVGTIDIPKDQFLKSVTYDAGNKEIVFVFETSEGDKTVRVSVADLVDTYTAGNGLQLDENNKFSVKINEDSESYITVTAEGIKVSGIDAALAAKANAADVYTKAQADDKFLTNADIDNLATKAELNTVSEATTANTNAIAVINGNESQEGSIKKSLSDAKAYTDNSVSAETARATAAETANANAIAVINGNEAQEGSIKKALKDAKDYTDNSIAGVRSDYDTQIAGINDALNTKANKSEVYTIAEIDAKGYLTSTDIAGLATKEEVSTETTRATQAESNLQSAINTANVNIATNTSDIASLNAEVASQNLIADETNSVKLVKSKDASGTELMADVKLDTSATNIIRVTGNGLIADVEMTYSQSTNKITFSNGVTIQEFELAGASLLENGYYDSVSKQIVLVTRLADGTIREIRIDAAALIHTLKVDNGTNNPIKLSKTIDPEGVDVLSARLDISTESHNLILNNNGTLYASNEAKNMTGLWEGEEKSLQWIVSQIEGASGEIEDIVHDVETLQSDMTQVKSDVSSLQTELTTVSARVTQNTIDIATNRGSIETLTTQVSDLNGRVTNLTNEVNDLEETVSSYETRVTSLETDMTQVKSNVSKLLTDVDRIDTQLGDISGQHTVAERLEVLEREVYNGDYGTY